MNQIVRILYTCILAGLAIYALHVVVLIVLYLLHRKDEPVALPVVTDDALPNVTVQVPLRNEKYVVRRVLQAVARLDWPRDCLEIQVLDDSDDETIAEVDAEVVQLREQGVDIHVVRRERPTGYKAGALAEGTALAKGEFLVIFDADFVPAPDFLRQTVPYFLTDPTLGMVQARWTHLNADYSLMTRVQALALDAHFSVEHIARGNSRLLTNFNGAAGVWRKATIADAGGWQTDTVTEDLDLSYRAQLAGWRVLYLPDVAAPAELTPLVTAFKAQQTRWAKGAFQCLRKLAVPILRSRRLTVAQKVMALLHLGGYGNQPLILLMILLTLPMVLVDPRFSDFTIWLGALVSIPPFLYVLGQMHFYRDWPRRIIVYPVLMLLWIGLAWSLTLAAFKGLFSWGGDFVRTPKFEITGSTGEWHSSEYRPRISLSWLAEAAIGVYVCTAIWFAVRLDHSHLVPLVLGYALGELVILGMTVSQAVAARKSDVC